MILQKNTLARLSNNELEPDEINILVEKLIEARENDAIFTAGNGGSATASSMGNDLGFDILKKTGTNKPFRFHPLTDNVASITAISNDSDYRYIFLEQLKLHYRKGDLLLVISASGNSPNLVECSDWVQEQGGEVIALLGFDGGVLLNKADHTVHFKTHNSEYGIVEDAHLSVNHILKPIGFRQISKIKLSIRIGIAGFGKIGKIRHDILLKEKIVKLLGYLKKILTIKATLLTTILNL